MMFSLLTFYIRTKNPTFDCSGYITPFIMNFLLGETGAYLLLTMIMMALMSSGSREVMAISSILVYDIYKTYVNPFRL